MPSDGAGSSLRRLLPDRIVLTFHGLGTSGRSVDAAERPYWIEPSAFEAAIAHAATTPGVEITFDDGNRSDVEIALPRLLEVGMRATFFVLAGRYGEEGSLRPCDLATLVRHGMQIGSHGEHHLDWTRATDATMRRELNDARRRIEDASGVAVRSLSVPFGRFDARVLGLAAEAGYAGVHTSSGGLAGVGDWLVPRNTVREDLDAERVIGRLRGWPARLDAAFRNPLRALRHSAPMRGRNSLRTASAGPTLRAAATCRD